MNQNSFYIHSHYIGDKVCIVVSLFLLIITDDIIKTVFCKCEEKYTMKMMTMRTFYEHNRNKKKHGKQFRQRKTSSKATTTTLSKQNKGIKTPILVVNNMNQNSFYIHSHDIGDKVYIVVDIVIYAEKFELTLNK